MSQSLSTKAGQVQYMFHPGSVKIGGTWQVAHVPGPRKTFIGGAQGTILTQ